jgi:hypothetical protein
MTRENKRGGGGREGGRGREREHLEEDPVHDQPEAHNVQGVGPVDPPGVVRDAQVRRPRVPCLSLSLSLSLSVSLHRCGGHVSPARGVWCACVRARACVCLSAPPLRPLRTVAVCPRLPCTRGRPAPRPRRAHVRIVPHSESGPGPASRPGGVTRACTRARTLRGMPGPGGVGSGPESMRKRLTKAVSNWPKSWGSRLEKKLTPMMASGPHEEGRE